MSQLDKRLLNQLIEEGAYHCVLEHFDAAPYETCRLLTRLTYDPASNKHANVIEAFRFLSEKRAEVKPDFFREIIRRHLWGMNDEGGNIDWSAPEIIGAVIAGSFEHFKSYLPYAFNAAIVEPAFHPSLKRALAMIEKINPAAVKEYQEQLSENMPD